MWKASLRGNQKCHGNGNTKVDRSPRKYQQGARGKPHSGNKKKQAIQSETELLNSALDKIKNTPDHRKPGKDLFGRQ